MADAIARKWLLYTIPNHSKTYFNITYKDLPMYYHIKDRKWSDNRKQVKQHYGVSYFRRLLHNREIIYTNTNDIANDELHSHTKVDNDTTIGK